MGMAYTLVASITNGEAGWAWANNAENVGKVKLLQNNLLGTVDDFARAYLVTEIKKLKADMKSEHLFTALSNFEKIGSDVTALDKMLQKLTKAKAVMG
eukprot:10555816-Alexandrium_andersonii.AAC.1